MTARRSAGPQRAGDAVAVRGGRRALSKTEIHDWVALSGISGEAVALYGLLRMHVNRDRGDDLVWTSTLSLAVLMGKPRGDKISGLLKELVAVGAIEIHRVGMPAHNEYTVHQLPPPEHTGPTTLKAWYALHRPLIDMKRAAEQATRTARRARKAGSPVTPDSGQPVTPDSGQPDAPDSGQHVAPDSGRKPTAVEPARSEPSPPSGGKGERLPPAAPDWAALADELLAAAAHWSPTELRKVLADPAITERPWPLVRLAFLLAARDGGRTWTPRRLLSSGCPYWPRAARELAAAGGGGPLPDPAPPARPRPAPARELARPWCGQIDCDRTTRQQLDPGGAPMWDVQAGEFVACARCGPTAGIVQTAVGLP